MLNILAIVLIVLCLVLVLLLAFIIIYRNKDSMISGQINGKVLYNNTGVNVENQNIGESKGSYFEPAMVDYSTFVFTSVKSSYNSSSMVWRIELVDINSKERYFTSFRNAIYIGRANDTAGQQKIIIPSDLKISRTHCVIFEFNGDLYIQDCESANHTYLDGKIVEGTRQLYSGAVIQIGNTKLSVLYGH